MKLSRRRFLVASSGLCLPLPFLGSLHGCKGDKDGSESVIGHPLVVVRPGSGVVQADGDEPERFWPRELGPITQRSLSTQNSDRVLSELADYADRLLLVRGTQFPFEASREEHAGGGNQLLTAARPGPPTSTVMTYAMGESIDNWIARQSDVNGGEPLTLYAGRRDNYGEEVLSYRGALDLRGAEDDPWAAYRRLIGGDRNKYGSVNDLVLEQLADLAASPKISAEDKRRLQTHTDSIREFEVLADRLAGDIKKRMKDVSGESTRDDFTLEVARLHCHLIALVFSTGHARAATLQIGDRLDNGQYRINGRKLPSYHTISHRNIDADQLGNYGSAADMHFEINRMHTQVFAYLLDRLDERDMLDRSVAVMVSDVATGTHRYDDVPWVIAGRGDGTLRQGHFIDAGGVNHNRLLATLLTATGHRDTDGGPITHFGDETVRGGTIDEMLA